MKVLIEYIEKKLLTNGDNISLTKKGSESLFEGIRDKGYVIVNKIIKTILSWKEDPWSKTYQIFSGLFYCE